jgi:hypothetical protein
MVCAFSAERTQAEVFEVRDISVAKAPSCGVDRMSDFSVSPDWNAEEDDGLRRFARTAVRTGSIRSTWPAGKIMRVPRWCMTWTTCASDDIGAASFAGVWNSCSS